MIKHECEDLFQHFSRLPAFFISYKTSFFLDYCPNFVSFSKLLTNYFLNEDGSNINQFPFLMLTNIDRRRQSSSELLYVICFEFLGPSKLSHSNFAWKGPKRCGIRIPTFLLFPTLSLILFPPWIIPYYSVFLYQVYIQQEPFSFSGRTIVLFRGRIPQKFS